MPGYLKTTILFMLGIFLKDFANQINFLYLCIELPSHIIAIKGLKMPSLNKPEVRSW
jgi:hypothetical protein